MDNMMNYTITEINNELFENNDSNLMMMYYDREDVVSDYHENNNCNYDCDNSFDFKYRSIDLASAMANHSSSYEHNMMYTYNNNKFNNNNNKYSSLYNFCLYPTSSHDVNHTHSYIQSREMKESVFLCPLFDETNVIIKSKKINIINITKNIIFSSDNNDNNDSIMNAKNNSDHHNHDKDEQQVVIQLVTTCLMTNIIEFDFSPYHPIDCMVS